MRFEINKASNYSAKEYREINSIEELMAFVKEVGEIIVWPDDQRITIYDDYME